MEISKAQLEKYGKELALKNTAANRWSSAVVVLRRFAESWSAVFKGLYLRSSPHTNAEIKTRRREILETLAVLEPVNEVLKDLQASDATTGARLPFLVNTLLATHLDVEKPLCIVDPEAPRLVSHGTRVANSATSDNSEESTDETGKAKVKHIRHRAPHDLTDIGKKMREAMREEVIARFIKPRYLNPDERTSFLFDAGAMAHPFYVQLKWVDRWNGEVSSVQVKSRIRSVVLKQLEAVFKVADEDGNEQESDGGGGDGDGGRQLTLQQAFRKPQPSAGAELFGMDSDSEESEEGQGPGTPAAQAAAMLAEYEEWCKTVRKEWKEKGWHEVKELWACDEKGLPNGLGAHKFPQLALVFRCLLGVAGSAAILERDFSVAGNLLTQRRTMLDAAYVEMILFLHLNSDFIPPLSTIPALLPEQRIQAVPLHLRTRADFLRYSQLDPIYKTRADQADDMGDDEFR